MDFKQKVEYWMSRNSSVARRQEKKKLEEKRKEYERNCRPFQFRPIKYNIPTTSYTIRYVDFFIDKKRRMIYYRINKKKILVRILKNKTGNRWKSFEIEDVKFFYRWIFQKNQRPVLLLYL